MGMQRRAPFLLSKGMTVVLAFTLPSSLKKLDGLVGSLSSESDSESVICPSNKAWIRFNYNQIIRFFFQPFRFPILRQNRAVQLLPQSAENHSILYCRNRYLGHKIGEMLWTKISKSFAVTLRYFHYFKEWQYKLQYTQCTPCIFKCSAFILSEKSTYLSSRTWLSDFLFRSGTPSLHVPDLPLHIFRLSFSLNIWINEKVCEETITFKFVEIAITIDFSNFFRIFRKYSFYSPKIRYSSSWNFHWNYKKFRTSCQALEGNAR